MRACWEGACGQQSTGAVRAKSSSAPVITLSEQAMTPLLMTMLAFWFNLIHPRTSESPPRSICDTYH